MATRDSSTLPKIRRPKALDEPMKNRTVKVDDPTWDAASARAAREGLPIAEVVRHYLREYAAGD